jgi:hypothetical protein
MPICQPCRMPHNAAVCEDTLAGRSGLARSCFCQHKAYSTAEPGQSAVAEEVPPVPETHTDTTVVGAGEETAHQQGQSRVNTVRSSTFSRAGVDQGQWGRRG